MDDKMPDSVFERLMSDPGFASHYVHQVLLTGLREGLWRRIAEKPDVSLKTLAERVGFAQERAIQVLDGRQDGTLLEWSLMYAAMGYTIEIESKEIRCPKTNHPGGANPIKPLDGTGVGG
jgi:hypothetical protein